MQELPRKGKPHTDNPLSATGTCLIRQGQQNASGRVDRAHLTERPNQWEPLSLALP